MSASEQSISTTAIADMRLSDLERLANGHAGPAELPLREWVALAEAWRIAHALRQAGGNRSAAARALGIGRRTLYTKMEKLGLVPTWVVARERDQDHASDPSS